MSIDLGAENRNYAVFLPAVQEGFAKYVITPGRDAPAGICPSDLNFLRADNKLWRYKNCLASAGILAYSNSGNAITQRDPSSSWVLGDSGGYQIGTGALKELRRWGADLKNPEVIKSKWNETNFINDMLRWVECNCDYAMTLDMPLWIRQNPNSKTPVRHLSDRELLDITVENLRYIQGNRGQFGSCKFLNVIQGLSDAAEDEWYSEVKKIRCDGWAFGGTEGWKGGLTRVLRRVLILRDDGEFDDGQDFLHVLGVSQTNWSIALTEIQRGVQRSANSKFQLTYDSSTPFLNANTYKNYFKPSAYDCHIGSWLRVIEGFPTSQASVKDRLDEPFCEGSPLSGVLRLRDVCVEFEPFQASVLTEFGGHALANHNVFMMIDGFNRASSLANDIGKAPAEFLDMIDIIQRAFVSEEWESILNSNRQFLEYISNYSVWRKL